MEILKTLDNVPRLIFWRVDDAMIMFIPFLLGILFGSITLLLGGFIAKWIYAGFRKRFAYIKLKCLVYWTLGIVFRRLPPSYVRKFRR